jgi:hypothetical protein
MPVPTGRVAPEKPATPPARRCPRCGVRLEHEKTLVTKGLTGIPSTEHRFTCPACDTRYRWSTRDERWKELS